MDITFYQEMLKLASEANLTYKKKANLFSIFRLITFLMFLTFLVLGISNKDLLYFFFATPSLLSFIIMVVIYDKLSLKHRYYENKCSILTNYCQRYEDKWHNFKDGGEDFKTDKKFFLEDLDIVGKTSLFKYLTVCGTKFGRKKLVDSLSNQLLTKEQLQIQQINVQEMSKQIDFSIDLQIALKEYIFLSKRSDVEQALKNLSEPVPFNFINLIIGAILCLSTVATFILAFSNFVSWTYFMLIFLLQLGYATYYQGTNLLAFSHINNATRAMAPFKNVFVTICKANFESKELKKMQSDCSQYGLNAVNKIMTLSNINDFRRNFIGYIIFNSFFSLNVLIVFFYSKYQKKYGSNIKKSLEVVATFEMLGSLAVLPQTKKITTLPTITTDMSIVFTDLKHPLIVEKVAVPNSFKTDASVNIITGSNMSGKTSFLRTIGINLILMQAGTSVLAKNFSAPLIGIFTSMRIRDDISQGISTFYAELLRIKEAIDYLPSRKPMICLVDEVFRGTNSNDRILGAISLIKKLKNANVILMLTTHDFELCEINDVRNYHFAEYYVDDKIMFDYLLKGGKCQTTNAKYLMKLVGIV